MRLKSSDSRSWPGEGGEGGERGGVQKRRKQQTFHLKLAGLLLVNIHRVQLGHVRKHANHNLGGGGGGGVLFGKVC